MLGAAGSIGITEEPGNSCKMGSTGATRTSGTNGGAIVVGRTSEADAACGTGVADETGPLGAAGHGGAAGGANCIDKCSSPAPANGCPGTVASVETTDATFSAGETWSASCTAPMSWFR